MLISYGVTLVAACAMGMRWNSSIPVVVWGIGVCVVGLVMIGRKR